MRTVEYFLRVLIHCCPITESKSQEAALDELSIKNPGLDLSRQLVYHHRKRFLRNLALVQNGLRQIHKDIKLPEEDIGKEERAKKLLELVKNGSTTIHSFSQEFHKETNKTFLALCK